MGILKGSVAALLTPYKNEDKSIDFESLRHYIGFVLDKGADGILCNSSVGDSQALSLDEQLEIIRLAKDVAKEEAPVIAGIGSPCYKNTKELASEAKRLGVDALLLMLPYYYSFSDDSMLDYVKEVIKYAKLPIYIYNVPIHGKPMSLDLTVRLSQLDEIAGLKDTSADAYTLEYLLTTVNNDFDILIGKEEFCTLGQIAGAKGYITPFGAIFPELMAEIYKAVLNQELSKAMWLQKLLIKALRFALKYPFPMGFSLLLQARGIDFKNTSIHTLSASVLEELQRGQTRANELVKKVLSTIHEVHLCSFDESSPS